MTGIGDSSQWREIERLRLMNRKLKLAVVVLLIGGTLSWLAGLLSRSDGSSAGCQQSRASSAAIYQEGPPLDASPALFRNPKGPTSYLPGGGRAPSLTSPPLPTPTGRKSYDPETL